MLVFNIMKTMKVGLVSAHIFILSAFAAFCWFLRFSLLMLFYEFVFIYLAQHKLSHNPPSSQRKQRRVCVLLRLLSPNHRPRLMNFKFRFVLHALFLYFAMIFRLFFVSLYNFIYYLLLIVKCELVVFCPSADAFSNNSRGHSKPTNPAVA